MSEFWEESDCRMSTGEPHGARSEEVKYLFLERVRNGLGLK